MKGAVGTKTLNRRVLGFCPVNERDGRVGRDEVGETERLGGSKGVRQGKKYNVKGSF